MASKTERELNRLCAGGDLEKAEEVLNMTDSIPQSALNTSLLKTCENYVSSGDHLEVVSLLKRYILSEKEQISTLATKKQRELH